MAPGWSRRLALALATGALVVLAAEAIGFLAWWVAAGEPFRYGGDPPGIEAAAPVPLPAGATSPAW